MRSSSETRKSTVGKDPSPVLEKRKSTFIQFDCEEESRDKRERKKSYHYEQESSDDESMILNQGQNNTNAQNAVIVDEFADSDEDEPT